MRNIFRKIGEIGIGSGEFSRPYDFTLDTKNAHSTAMSGYPLRDIIKMVLYEPKRLIKTDNATTT